jgi:hypothetical protein
VVDPVALKDLDRTVIPFDREVDRQFSLRHAEDGAEASVQSEMVRRRIELDQGRLEGSRSCGRLGPVLDLLHQ